VNTRWKTN